MRVWSWDDTTITWMETEAKYSFAKVSSELYAVRCTLKQFGTAPMNFGTNLCQTALRDWLNLLDWTNRNADQL
jgi:hypothetical protein